MYAPLTAMPNMLSANPLMGGGVAVAGSQLADALAKRRASKKKNPMSPGRLHAVTNPDLGE